jgi:hypothetical protein
VVSGSKVWVAVGLLCVSMAARAEYKEVWNPPEAARDAQHMTHSKHAVPVGSGAVKKTAHREKAAPHVKVAAKPKARSTSSAVVKSARAPVSSTASRKSVHAKPAAVVAAKPAQVAQSPAPQSGNTSVPRELPPILH